MKNIIIGGSSRAGKSILSNRISERIGSSYLPMDSLVRTFQNVYPEHGICHWTRPHLEICESFSPFLFEYIKNLTKEQKEVYIFDIFHVTPKDIYKYIDLNEFEVVFLGYPEIELNSKLSFISDYAKTHDCWTKSFNINNNDLKHAVLEYIQFSSYLKDECAKYKLRFVDTGIAFEKSINEIEEELLNKVLNIE